MECLTCSEDLSAFIDHELMSEERVKIEEHLENCPFCSAEYESLIYSYDLIEQLQQSQDHRLELSPLLWPRIESQLVPRARPRPEFSFRLSTAFAQAWVPLAAAAGLAVVVMTLSWFWPYSDQRLLEQNFISWIESRERLEQEHHQKWLVRQGQDLVLLFPNPFVAEQSPQGNPFAE